jgi:hypothetical protein
LFQITIVTPSGGGTGAAEGLADELAALYPLNDQLVKTGFAVQVATPVNPGPEQQENTAFALPVSFQYRADTTT